MTPQAPGTRKPRSISTHLAIGSNTVTVDGSVIPIPAGRTPTETALAHLRARARPELILRAHIEQEGSPETLHLPITPPDQTPPARPLPAGLPPELEQRLMATRHLTTNGGPTAAADHAQSLVIDLTMQYGAEHSVTLHAAEDWAHLAWLTRNFEAAAETWLWLAETRNEQRNPCLTLLCADNAVAAWRRQRPENAAQNRHTLAEGMARMGLLRHHAALNAIPESTG
ncbi:hypothetical protein [Streptomyces sp. S1D4-20]|uniref:hypothetical protein n=1 Tax=Streptomyces sp. S1D4-20 TaxID=2594462 RepID=UPI001164D40E|nr:hypothetical protein [Streptomyces sp. S1D4-20]QDN54274.1 hypothetical protein FNV67_01550 [Streptomyces sp. S1D4-20]